jgi:hypothetical protein
MEVGKIELSLNDKYRIALRKVLLLCCSDKVTLGTYDQIERIVYEALYGDL